jgi:hypothetical protein
MGRLRAGDVVEVKSLNEILATLDTEGTLEGMPFMSEMARYCGRRFRVAKRAHKTCDTVQNIGGARVQQAVHLEEVRCDGSAHGGCQAYCLLFWKEAWLKPVLNGEEPAMAQCSAETAGGCIPERWSYKDYDDDGQHPIRYRCQITELPRFTTKLAWWDIRQYIEDIVSGNVGLGQLLRGIRFSLFRAWMRHGVGYRIIKRAFNWIQRRRGGSSFPVVEGALQKTPHVELGLEPGEWVQVKRFDEIMATVDCNNKNRGLGFDTCEMRLHCEKTFRVKARIDRIINEHSGEMMRFSNPCITLEGVYCSGETTQGRAFCPRAITPYWREIWLQRASAPGEAGENIGSRKVSRSESNGGSGKSEYSKERPAQGSSASRPDSKWPILRR